jgi:hypothetical protein
MSDKMVPTTEEAFEANLAEAAAIYGLAVTDDLRMVYAGFVHHIDNSKATHTVQELADVLYKSLANKATWAIDQAIKQKRKDEYLAKLAAEQAERDAKAAAEGLIVKPALELVKDPSGEEKP